MVDSIGCVIQTTVDGLNPLRLVCAGGGGVQLAHLLLNCGADGLEQWLECRARDGGDSTQGGEQSDQAGGRGIQALLQERGGTVISAAVAVVAAAITDAAVVDASATVAGTVRDVHVEGDRVATCGVGCGDGDGEGAGLSRGTGNDTGVLVVVHTVWQTHDHDGGITRGDLDGDWGDRDVDGAIHIIDVTDVGGVDLLLHGEEEGLGHGAAIIDCGDGDGGDSGLGGGAGDLAGGVVVGHAVRQALNGDLSGIGGDLHLDRLDRGTDGTGLIIDVADGRSNCTRLFIRIGDGQGELLGGTSRVIGGGNRDVEGSDDGGGAGDLAGGVAVGHACWQTHNGDGGVVRGDVHINRGDGLVDKASLVVDVADGRSNGGILNGDGEGLRCGATCGGGGDSHLVGAHSCRGAGDGVGGGVVGHAGWQTINGDGGGGRGRRRDDRGNRITQGYGLICNRSQSRGCNPVGIRIHGCTGQRKINYTVKDVDAQCGDGESLIRTGDGGRCFIRASRVVARDLFANLWIRLIIEGDAQDVPVVQNRAEVAGQWADNIGNDILEESVDHTIGGFVKNFLDNVTNCAEDALKNRIDTRQTKSSQQREA
ncbi:hypothetical protein [Corynebacterium efficiens YS-314]|uniref:Uncharacterized protein n=1 Tax=Corynebacterium efficiens (strain DSM 44549 / YS-314 / AJ 12310 / JCM 11189 / NBRC 100395) TaxID=196164 RepID=Q8FRZ1_COREF|nr:hypothetical protein [Corynebacterium efficiens YS-314]